MTQSNRLPTLADEARQAHAETLHHTKRAADRALAAGAALNEAKALCAHGTWGDWLAQTGIPERSAQRYMKLHRAGCNSAMVADMGTAKAETIAALALKLLPQDGAGIEAYGFNLDGSTAYALTWPEGDNLTRYWACYLFPDPDLDFFVTRVCHLPIALGLLHSGFPDHFDIYNTRRMTPEETAQARAEMEGIAAGEDEKREGWLQYGRALNEARTLLQSDQDFERWIAANGLGQMDGREVSRNEREAAMRDARAELEGAQ